MNVTKPTTIGLLSQRLDHSLEPTCAAACKPFGHAGEGRSRQA